MGALPGALLRRTSPEDREARSQDEQPEENIQYPVPPCGIPQSGRISNNQHGNSRESEWEPEIQEAIELDQTP